MTEQEVKDYNAFLEQKKSLAANQINAKTRTMSKKKPYTISETSDGLTSITMAGMTELFKTRETALSFALALVDQLSDRRTGIFHLQDTPDGKLQMIMHKTGNVITFKDYDQAAKLADMLVKELLP